MPTKKGNNYLEKRMMLIANTLEIKNQTTAMYQALGIGLLLK